MAVQPNLVLGAVGAVVAILTGAYISSNWDNLTGRERYEVEFSSTHTDFEPRDGTVASGGSRTERYEFRRENVSRVQIYLTWQDSIASAPEIEIEVKDPRNRTLATQRHQGGVSGIRFEVFPIPPSEVPSGRHVFEARGHELALEELYSEWPPHPEGKGNWTFTIRSSTTSGPGAPTPYTLRLGFDSYHGALRRIEEPQK